MTETIDQKRLAVSFDEKRHAYWVRGMGFDFWLFFVSGGQWLECDSVIRQGDPQERYISILSRGTPSPDYLETALLRELAMFWDMRPWR